MAKKLNTSPKPTKSEKAKAKSKKTAELVEKDEVAAKRHTFCQFCKNHTNHPSTCKLTKAYVARKQAACPNFK